MQSFIKREVGIFLIWLTCWFDGIMLRSSLRKQFNLRSIDLAFIFKVPEKGMWIFAEGPCVALHELKCLAVGIDLDGATDTLQLGATTSTRYIRLCT